MFTISYIDNNTDEILHKGSFKTTKEASEWATKQGNKITALKLLVWDEELQCNSTLRTL